MLIFFELVFIYKLTHNWIQLLSDLRFYLTPTQEGRSAWETSSEEIHFRPVSWGDAQPGAVSQVSTEIHLHQVHHRVRDTRWYPSFNVCGCLSFGDIRWYPLFNVCGCLSVRDIRWYPCNMLCVLVCLSVRDIRWCPYIMHANLVTWTNKQIVNIPEWG